MENELVEKPKPEKTVVPAVKKLLNGVAKSAQSAVQGMAFVLFLGGGVFLSVLAYFFFALEARWLLLVPGLLMGLPLLGAGAFVFMLHCVAHLPGTLKDAMSGTGTLKKRHVERALKLEQKKGFMAGVRKLRLTAALLWDVAWNASDHGDAVGDAQMALWLFNPVFWVIMVWCLAAMVLTQLGFSLFCLLHWLF